MDVGKVYDLVAKEYHSFYFDKVFFSNFLDKLDTLVDKRARILDLGTGSGTVINYLANKGYTNLTGIDLSKNMLEIAKEKIPLAKFEQRDLRDINYNKNFDAILSFYALCHIPREDLVKVFSKVYSSLVSGGYFMIGVTQGKGSIISKNYLGSSHSVPYFMFTQKELVNLAKGSGFNVITIESELYEDEIFGKEVELYLLAQKPS